MTTVDVLVIIDGHPLEIGRLGRLKEIDDRLLKLALVAFDCEYIVPTLLDDLLGNGLLTPHRIDGHNTAFDLQQLQ